MKPNWTAILVDLAIRILIAFTKGTRRGRNRSSSDTT
jgi:hypothetical protein